jgi:hypothetical protein
MANESRPVLFCGRPAWLRRQPRCGLEGEADRTGRIRVGPDLSVPGHPDIFAIGDTALSLAWDGQPVPGLAPAAKQGGAYVASVLRARLRGRKPPPPFRYRHQGSLAAIGRRSAVADFGRVKVTGAADPVRELIVNPPTQVATTGAAAGTTIALPPPSPGAGISKSEAIAAPRRGGCRGAHQAGDREGGRRHPQPATVSVLRCLDPNLSSRVLQPIRETQ